MLYFCLEFLPRVTNADACRTQSQHFGLFIHVIVTIPFTITTTSHFIVCGILS